MCKTYCDDCIHLSPKEYDQINNKEPHICVYFNVVMKHAGHHPSIPAPDDCMGYEKEKEGL